MRKEEYLVCVYNLDGQNYWVLIGIYKSKKQAVEAMIYHKNQTGNDHKMKYRIDKRTTIEEVVYQERKWMKNV